MYPAAEPPKKRRRINEQDKQRQKTLLGCSSIFTKLQTRGLYGKQINHPAYTSAEKSRGIFNFYSPIEITFSLRYKQNENNKEKEIDDQETRNTLDDRQIQEFTQFYGKDHEQYITRIVKGNLPTRNDEVALNAFCDKMVELTVNSWSSTLQKSLLPITLLSCLAKINSALSQHCLNTIFNKILPHCNGEHNTQGDSVLHLAVLCQQPTAVISTLLTCNATKEIIDKPNHRDETPLSIAGLNGDKEAAYCLITQGARLKTSHGIDFTVMPIIAAARTGQMAMMDFLLISQYYDVNEIQYRRNTPLAVTPLIECIKFGYFHNAKKLIQIYGADVNFSLQARFGGDFTVMPLLWYLVQAPAKNSQNIYEINDFTQWLCANGADVNFIDTFGNSILWLAINNRLVDIVKILLDAGANPHFYHAANAKHTPLLFALLCENYDIITLLIEKIVSSNPISKNNDIVTEALTHFRESISKDLKNLPISNVKAHNNLRKALQAKLRSNSENNIEKLHTFCSNKFSSANNNIGNLWPIVNSIHLYFRVLQYFNKLVYSIAKSSTSTESIRMQPSS